MFLKHQSGAYWDPTDVRAQTENLCSPIPVLKGLYRTLQRKRCLGNLKETNDDREQGMQQKTIKFAASPFR